MSIHICEGCMDSLCVKNLVIENQNLKLEIDEWKNKCKDYQLRLDEYLEAVKEEVKKVIEFNSTPIYKKY